MLPPLLLAAVLAAAPTKAATGPLPPPPAEKTFAERYPKPMINATVETAVPGLKVIWVFDHSQLAEDPIIPQPWFDTTDGAKFRGDVDGLSKALDHLGFVPKSEADALAVLGALVKVDEHAQLIQDPKAHPGLDAIPKAIRDTLRAPVAEKKGEAFLVSGFVFQPAQRSRFRREDPIPAETYEIALEVGPRSCKYDFKPKKK